MKLKALAGYKDVYGKSNITYEEVLKDVSSDVTIMLLISLNNELNTTGSHDEIQKRLFNLVSYRFTTEQKRKALYALNNYDLIFGRRYLLAMLIKELHRNNVCYTNPDEPIHEHNFYLAYLLVVDELNKDDDILREHATKIKEEKMPCLPLLWASINQFEFNHSVNAAYELFKLLCFVKYAHREKQYFLNELLHKRGSKNLDHFVSGFYQILSATLIENKDEWVKKLIFINPEAEKNKEELRLISANFLSGKSTIKVDDLRKYPLYETNKRGFMIIDEDMYRKKIFRGPLFDLHKETSLKDKIRFEDYKNEVSKYCFEDICFRSIIKTMIKSKFEISHFDDNLSSQPDLFYRKNGTILLIEFKDYLFPDKITTGKDYNSYKKYIDERFIISDKEKPKGIEQIINNLVNLFDKKYVFDSQLITLLNENKRIEIFPIVCHTDFMFTMPGINEYLNVVFEQKLLEKGIDVKQIRKITLISLETIFDYSLRGGDLVSLSKLVERYWNIISNRKSKCQKNYSLDNFLSTTSSFDEIYTTIFSISLKGYNFSGKKKMNSLIEMSGITQDIFDEEISVL